MLELKLIDISMGLPLYEMYQDIPSLEMGSSNHFYGISNDKFKNLLKTIKEEEVVINPKLNTTTNRYILFDGNELIGEVGIRTTLNDFWINKGSQIFYKIRVSKRGLGYGKKILQLALNECKRLGFDKIRINCDDTNTRSIKVIASNGGVVDIKSYETKDGSSSSYIINLK